MLKTFGEHWPEYSIEAAGLGFFMLSACAFGVLLFHPSSPAVAAIPNSILRRVLMGAAMGSTAIAIIHSPWGKRSGAHVNPATTLAFFRLGKVKPADAFFYVAAQFVGGITGTLIAVALLGKFVSAPEVNYVVTQGEYGAGVAFAAEVFITFVLMTVVLNVSNSPRLSRWTGVFAGALVLVYISVEAPLSGMSMNPARTFASAFAAREWTALWVYFTAPPLGMLAAAELYKRTCGLSRVYCAKLHHRNTQRCIFNCEFKRIDVGSHRTEVGGQTLKVGKGEPLEITRSATFATAKLLLAANL
ncbi:MAG TPA: aquaporin [Pyrinomonadaceae bacterium]|nr:aquaporin [Pyrinomonadaceae bacterium]